MDRRTLLIGSTGAFLSACTTPAPSPPLAGEDVRVASVDADVQLLLRHKPAQPAPRPARTLLLVHGLTYPGSASFDLPLGGRSWMDHLARRGFDVWSVDIRGYGGSTRPSAMDQPPESNPPQVDATAGAADVAAAADFIRRRNGVDWIDVVGWSWGTVLAARFAAAHPQAVGRLVLYAPVWRWPGGTLPRAPAGAYRKVTTEAARRTWLNGVPAAAQANLIPAGWFEQWASANWATDPIGARAEPPVLRAPNGPLVEVVQAWRDGQVLFDAAAIRARTLVVVGEWDSTTPPQMARELHATLARSTDASFALIPEGTHQVFLERNRELLFAVVQEFLERA